MKKILLAVIFTLFTTHIFAQDTGISFEPPELTVEVASRYPIYSMAASNSYYKKDRVKFAIEKLGSIQVDTDEKPTDIPTIKRKTGLAYDIFQKKNSNELILHFVNR